LTSNVGKLRSRVLIGALVLFAAIGPFLVKADVHPQVWMERHVYTRTIGVGMMYYHQYKHEGALAGYAYLISSTGSAALTYQWRAPWLFVCIVNQDSKPITVTWEEDFWVN
jgi:hypothetical protein